MPKKKENLSPEEKLIKAVILKEEEPYKLPDNWVWIRLGETGDYKKGPFGSSLTKSMFVPKGENTVKVYEQKNAIQKDWKLGNYYITEEYFNKAMTSFEVKESNIIVSCAGTIGETYIMPENIEKGIINQALMKIDLNKNINKKYYLLYFDYILKRISNTLSNGSAIKNIPPFKIFKELPFVLPPFNEQKRIVEKLDSLFEKTGRIKEIIEEVKEKTSLRRETVLSKAFTGELTEKWRAENKTENAKELLLKLNEEKLKNNPKAKIKDISEMLVNENEVPYKIPENWVWTRLGDIANILNGDRGKNYPAKNKLSEKGEIPFISASNLEDGKILTENLLFLSDEQYKKLRAGKLQENDLLFCIRGSLGKYGKNYFSQGAIASSLVIIRNFLQNQEAIEYIGNYFKTILLKNEIAKYNNGTAQPNLSAENLKKFLLPLPPLKEQKEIVRILDKFFEEENKISELISLEEKVEILEKTILDKAFRGELGTGNSDDEPAIELLKKTLENNNI